MSFATLRSSLLGLAILPGLATAAMAGQFDGMTVTVATFGGVVADAIRDNVGRMFEAEGGRLELVIGQPSTNTAKLLASRGQEPPFDILETVEELIPPLAAREVIEDIDLSRLPLLSELDPSFYDKTKIGLYFTEEGILYNKEAFAKAGIPAPTRYSDLADPRLKGRVTLPDISASGAFPVIVGSAIEQGGDERNVQPGLDLIKRIDPAQFWSSSTVAQTAMATGDMWANGGQAGIALRLRGKLDAGFVFPQIGDKKGILKANYLVKAKGAKHPAAVDWVLNAFLSEGMQLDWLKRAGQVPVNRKALEALHRDPQYAMFRLTPDEIAGMYRMDYGRINPALYTKGWTATIR